MNLLKTLLYDLKKIKAEHGLKSITAHKTDIPLTEFNQLQKEFNLDFEIDEGCMFSTYIPEQNIFIHLKSELINEDYVLMIDSDEVFVNDQKPAA